MPFFSVIIPTYNRVPMLVSALDSVRSQSFRDYELIIVDDGSNDGTREWLLNQPGDMRVLTQFNRGPGAARNFGLQQATGEYVAFLDSDDLWFHWTLETYRAVIRETYSPAFVVGKPFRFSNQTALNSVTRTDAKFVAFPDYLGSSTEWRWWGVSSFVIKAEALRDTRGFIEDNVNGEDGDLALKLGEAGGFVQITSPYTFAYREHDGNLTCDLTKTIAGVWHKVQSEKVGQYPGGERRRRERWRILTRHVRPVTLGCLQQDRRGEAWKLYRATFCWNLALGRWKYILGFPLRALVSYA